MWLNFKKISKVKGNVERLWGGTDGLWALGNNLEASCTSGVVGASGPAHTSQLLISRPITGTNDSDKCIQQIIGHLGQSHQPVSEVKTPAY